MTTFDELCRLETRARDQEIDLGNARDVMAHCSRLVFEKTLELGTARLELERLEARIRFLKQAPVVLLSEYEQVLYERDSIADELSDRRQEIKRLEEKCLDAYGSLPGLERDLSETRAKLQTLSKVIPFR